MSKEVKVLLEDAWEKFEKDNGTLLLNIDKSAVKLIFVHGFSAGLTTGLEAMALMRQSIWGGPAKEPGNG